NATLQPRGCSAAGHRGQHVECLQGAGPYPERGGDAVSRGAARPDHDAGPFSTAPHRRPSAQGRLGSPATCRGQTGGAQRFARAYGQGMVQRTDALRGGRESVGVMKGEVVSSILTGSTTRRL